MSGQARRPAPTGLGYEVFDLTIWGGSPVFYFWRIVQIFVLRLCSVINRLEYFTKTGFISCLIERK